MKKLIIEEDKEKKETIVYIRLDADLLEFVDDVATKLDSTRSKAMRAILRAAKNAGMKIK